MEHGLLVFTPQVIFPYSLWTRGLFSLRGLSHIHTILPVYLFLRKLEPYELLHAFNQMPGHGWSEKKYRNVCSDLKYAKPEVNRSTYGFDFLFKAFSLPVTFRSVETIKKLWVLELLLGPNTILSRNTIGNFIIIIIKLHIYEQLGDDWANPMRAWFLPASSCTGPSDGTQVFYVQHLGFLIMLYKEQATKHISSSSCLIL